MTARQAANPALAKVVAGASRWRIALSGAVGGHHEVGLERARPSPTAGGSVDGRALCTSTPLRMSTWSPRPAMNASCRSSRCTTTGGVAARTPGCTSHWPSGRRMPAGGTAVAMPSRPPASPSARSARDPVGPQHQRGAARAEPVVALQQGDLPTGPGQRAGGGEPADAGSDHDCCAASAL
jgi:hypothetical protein